MDKILLFIADKNSQRPLCGHFIVYKNSLHIYTYVYMSTSVHTHICEDIHRYEYA